MHSPPLLVVVFWGSYCDDAVLLWLATRPETRAQFLGTCTTGTEGNERRQVLPVVVIVCSTIYNRRTTTWSEGRCVALGLGLLSCCAKQPKLARARELIETLESLGVHQKIFKCVKHGEGPKGHFLGGSWAPTKWRRALKKIKYKNRVRNDKEGCCCFGCSRPCQAGIVGCRCIYTLLFTYQPIEESPTNFGNPKVFGIINWLIEEPLIPACQPCHPIHPSIQLPPLGPSTSQSLPNRESLFNDFVLHTWIRFAVIARVECKWSKEDLHVITSEVVGWQYKKVIINVPSYTSYF